LQTLIALVLILVLLILITRRVFASVGDAECSNCSGVLSPGAKLCNSCGQVTRLYMPNRMIWLGILVMCVLSFGVMAFCTSSVM